MRFAVPANRAGIRLESAWKHAPTRVAFFGILLLFFHQSIVGAQAVPPAGAGNVVNVASITAVDDAGQSQTVQSNSAVTQVAIPPVALWKSGDPSGAVAPGDEIRYTLRFENQSSLPLTGVTIRDPLDPGISGVSGITNGPIPDLGSGSGTINVSGALDAAAGEVRWHMATVPPGFLGEVSFRARVDPNLPNEAVVRNAFILQADQDPNGQASAEISNPVVGPVLSLDLAATRSRVEIGELTGFEIRVTNRDASLDLHAASVRLSLPAGFRYLEETLRVEGRRKVRPSIRGGGRKLTFDLGRVPAGETLTVVLAGVPGADARKGEAIARANSEATTPGGLPVVSGPDTASVEVIVGELLEQAVLAGRVYADRDGNGRPSAGDPAVPGVRLYLEDGTQVITDATGMYHMEGVRPGLHALKIDPESVPEGLNVRAGGVRGEGTMAVQFVDLGPSELFKANFTLTGGPEALAALRIRSDLPPVLASILFEAGSDTLRPEAEGFVEAYADLLQGAGGSAGSLQVREEGKAVSVLGHARARALESALNGVLEVGPAPPVTADREVEFPAVDGAEPTERPAASAIDPETELEARLKKLPRGLYLLAPEEGALVRGEKIDVDVAYPTELSPSLSVGGREIPDDRIGIRMRTSLSGMSLVRYIGVALDEGRNLLEAGASSATTGIAPIRRHVDRVGPVARILVFSEGGTQPADGRTPGRARIEVRDALGHPVADGTTLTVLVDQGAIQGKDADPVEEGFQIRVNEGLVRVRLSPAVRSETRRVIATAGEKIGEGEIRFGPHMRRWILSGLAQADWWSGGARVDPESGFGDLDGGNGADGRLALFAKGRIGEKDLVSFSYDSDRRTDEDEIFRVEDPTERFPVYGDGSVQSWELQSQKRFAARWERERAMAMYGDFRTGLTAAELARYDRPLSGGITHVESRLFSVHAFGATTPQTTVRDVLWAEGSSGPYRLSRHPLVAYSEKVTLEVRDRFHTERILSSSQQSRFTDYDIDYQAGTILFRSPVPSQDESFNPVRIVVTYEQLDAHGSNLVAGGRVGFRPSARYEAGLTTVHEEREAGDFNLRGMDMTWRPWAGAAVTGEYAMTDEGDESSGAFALRFTTSVGDHVAVSAYVRDVPEDYANPSMTGVSEIGTRKQGMEVRASLPDGSRLKAETFTQKREILGIDQSASGITWQRGAGPVNWEVGGQALSGTTELDGEDGNSGLLMAGVRARLGKRVDGSLYRQEIVAGETITGYPTRTQIGAGYRITDQVRAVLRHEIDQGDIQTSQRNLFGIEGSLNDNTTVESRYALENALNGTRGYALLGVKTRFPITDYWTADMRTERSETVVGLDGSDFTSLSAGAEYLPGRSKFTSRYEVRFGELETRHLVTSAGALKLTENLVLFARNRVNLSQPDATDSQWDADGLLGLAYRPLRSDRWNWLGRVEAIRGESLPGGQTNLSTAPSARGLQSVFELNYQPVDRWHLMGRYASRIAQDSLGGEKARTYTEVWETRTLVDVAPRTTAGVAFRLLRQPTTGTSLTGVGVESGFMVARDLWLVGGYNITGFSDQKFPDGDRREQGPFLSLRFKFDESLIAGLSGLAGKKGAAAPAGENQVTGPKSVAGPDNPE